MNVKCANEYISKINDVVERMNDFVEREGFDDELWFIDSAIMFLGDYKKVLEKAIQEAELKI